jgi:predicted RNase H-like HicB family nuclease
MVNPRSQRPGATGNEKHCIMKKSHPHRLPDSPFSMDLKLTAQIHRDGEWCVGFCPEMPEANGQGRTPEECVQSLKEAILLLMEDRREDAIRKLPKNTKILEPA